MELRAISKDTNNYSLIRLLHYLYQIYNINSSEDTSCSNIAFISGDSKIYRPNVFSPNSECTRVVFFKFQTFFITNQFENGIADFDFMTCKY